MNNDFIIQNIRSVYKKLGHPFFERGDYNLNNGGIRCRNRKADGWDDIRYSIFKEKGLYQIYMWVQTTDPGLTGLKKPCRPEGCAILVPGRYKYKGGYHKNDKSRWSLVQAGEVSVYRDWNKDNLLDFDPKTIQTGWFGINIHDPWKDDLEKVGDASLGCQVAHVDYAHHEFMNIYDESVKHWGEKVSYTLTLEQDWR
jgi:hypothetical protein